MRKVLLVAAVLATAVAGAAALSSARAQPHYGPGGYGCCGMMGGHGPGYYRNGYMMDWDYDRGYRRDYRGNRVYRDDRGRRLCWVETDSASGYGYYARCRR